MAVQFEAQQIGKRQSLANVIANIEADATPYTSMVDKRERPKQVLHSWQVKSYPVTGHRGVVDGKDATDFQSNGRKLIQCNGQKTWYKPGVSDFADEAEVAGVGKGEMAEQIADAIVTVKRQTEKRCLSAEDTKDDNGTTIGNETRGGFSWINNTAQALYPVPDGFRTPAAQIYSSSLATFDEEDFLTMARSSFKQRKGPFKMHAFLGIDLKAAFTNFSKYTDTVANKTSVRDFRQDAADKKLIHCIDKLVLDTGEVDLMPSSYLYTDADTGADSAYTHSSGLVVDMDKCGLAYTRLPRVVKLPYAGGGQKAIVDAIFLNMMDNVLGMMAMKINS